jgi:hypothetical protein
MNTNSLANLKPGGKPRRTDKLSTSVSIDLIKLINKDYKAFVSHMHSLDAKSYVDTYLKLLKLVLPKNINLNQIEDAEKPVFVIQTVSSLTTDEGFAEECIKRGINPNQ